jgi:protoheme IX farnesyltransferase
MTSKEQLRAYYLLTKPGIIRGNVIVASAGFFLASNGSIMWMKYIYVLFGMTLIIACGCVLNNYIDRGIDIKMKRTKNRALVTGAIPKNNALVFSVVLGLIGTLLLFKSNILTMFLGLFGLFAYVVIYGVAKRKTVYGTIIGSISGAVPPVAGYVAVTGAFNVEALLLFGVLVLWQMPHFYAIAIFQKSDYAAASIPVMPVIQTATVIQRRIVGYIIGFGVIESLLFVLSYVGWTYLVVMTILSLLWLRIGLQKHSVGEEAVWARQVFRFSLIILLVWSLLISVNWLIP